MMVAEAVKETIKKYTFGLLLTVGKKTCTNISKAIGLSHDVLYYPFRDAINQKTSLKSCLQDLAKREFKNKPITLVFDDSQITKRHAREIEGIDLSFDSSVGRAEIGLQMVTALITDGSIKIPIDVGSYISKKIMGKHFRSKSEIANQLTDQISNNFDIDLVLGDGHYSTKYFLSELSKKGLQFLMRMANNRIVTIGKNTGKLRELLRLKRNQHSAMISGYFDGNKYFFYVVKLKDGNSAYFVSLKPLNPKKIIELYRIRWSIELYHRTAKQSLGWKDCQMRAIERQELHSLHVMLAYTIAEIVRSKKSLANVEEAIRLLRKAKLENSTASITPSGENYLCFT